MLFEEELALQKRYNDLTVFYENTEHELEAALEDLAKTKLVARRTLNKLRIFLIKVLYGRYLFKYKFVSWKVKQNSYIMS